MRIKEYENEIITIENEGRKVVINVSVWWWGTGNSHWEGLGISASVLESIT